MPPRSGLAFFVFEFTTWLCALHPLASPHRKDPEHLKAIQRQGDQDGGSPGLGTFKCGSPLIVPGRQGCCARRP